MARRDPKNRKYLENDAAVEAVKKAGKRVGVDAEGRKFELRDRHVYVTKEEADAARAQGKSIGVNGAGKFYIIDDAKAAADKALRRQHQLSMVKITYSSPTDAMLRKNPRIELRRLAKVATDYTDQELEDLRAALGATSIERPDPTDPKQVEPE